MATDKIDRNAVIREAQKLAGKGQYDKAIAEWRKLIKETPDSRDLANIYNTIGDLCLKRNAKSEAVDAYKRAADLLAEEGLDAKAIAVYKKVLNIDPSRIDIHIALGDMNARKGLVGNALESYKVVADYYTKNNKKADALGIYQKMADLNPANVGFRVKLAGMYAKEGMKQEAIKAYLDAASHHVGREEFQDARQLLEKILEIDPNNKDVYYQAGIVYLKEGKFDEARKSLKHAFEANPGNEEIQNQYLEALAKTGRTGDAEEVYRKLLSIDSSRIDLHEKLYDLFISKKDFDKALAEASAIAEHKAESMDFEGAAEVFRGLIAITHDPPSAAFALADCFNKHGRTADGARELVKAADILIERGSIDDAREVLNRAIVLAPDLEEAKAKLNSLGGAAQAAPKQPEAVEEFLAPQEGELEEIVVPQPPQPEAPRFIAEDPAVAEALTEVDVLIKYGLAAKAVEQLEAVLRKFPDSPKVRTRLLDLYREQKKFDKAVIQALLLAELYDKQGLEDDSRSVLRTALEMAPGNKEIMARLGMTTEPKAEVPEAIETIETIEVPEAIETIEAPEAIESLEVPEIPELSVPEIDFGLQEPQETAEAAPVEPEPTEFITAEQESGHTVEQAENVSLEEQLVEEEPASSTESVVSEGSFEQQAAEPLAAEDTTEIWAEAEFYYQQGLFEEAKKYYERILDLHPGDKKAMERIVEIAREKEDIQEFSRLTEAVESLESLVDAGRTSEETVTRSDVESVRSLVQEITELRTGKKPPPDQKKPLSKPEQPAPVMSEIPSVPKFETPAEPAFAGIEEEPEESFADVAEDLAAAGPSEEEPQKTAVDSDFFDLAAELRDELGSAGKETPSSIQEQSLDEIFEEFKKGVEAHEKKEDEDTHYNLGVAYREMGLLDDAISEFNMTSEGESKFILSRYMLGLCYLEKGDFETAITEIQNALGYSYSFGEASEERIGMHYDLGLAYQGVGNNQAALEEFQKVYNLDPSYKEVAAKIQELQEGEFISLDSIKQDIEKEISFKFLEEGTRIELEEKNKPKKNKK